MSVLDDYSAARAKAVGHMAAIAAIGTACHKLRSGHDLHPEFQLTRWVKSVATETGEYFDGEDESGYPAPVYEPGTPILTLEYYHQRWGDERDITLPASYFEDGVDYLALEKIAIDKTAAMLAERARVAEQARLEQHEEQEREAYARLKTKYGDA